MAKKFFMVVDTETCNTIEQPIPYDIGYAICDSTGNIYVERSFVVREVFCDMKDVMSSAYYAEKIPSYWDDIKSGKRTLASIWDIRKIMKQDIKDFKVRKVGAYNMGFDKRALNNLIRYVSKSFLRWWFPFGIEYFCIWSMACNTILNRASYVKFALKNDFVSDSDNIITNAECAYRYITKETDFKENHTGLEDVKIEIAIMAYCYRQHQKIKSELNSACWRMVQRKRKEMDLRAAFRAA